MPTLHLINHADALASCLAVAGPDDAVLLLEDGVYAAAAGPPHAPVSELRALEVDVRARGLAGHLAEGVRMISDEQFVKLVAAHSPVVTWCR